MSKAAMNLQDSFLNQVRRENSEVRVLLVNGTLLRGTVKGFDNFTLILNNRNGQHLVYKHAVAQIVTHRPHVKTEDMQMGDLTGEADASTGGSTPDTTAVSSEKPAGERAASGHRASGSERAPRNDRSSGSGHEKSARPERERPAGSGAEKSGRPDRQHGDQHGKQKPKKEGFNTLDLSRVKLEEGKEQ